MREVADHMRLLMGLRYAVEDFRPLPYAASMPVRAGIVPDKGAANKAIRALVRFGVVRHVKEHDLRPLKPGFDGTRVFAPPESETR
jgi:hypothetical protein